MTNKHGIPVVRVASQTTARCLNKHTGKPKARFVSRFLAERFIAEHVQPKDRHLVEPYECGTHWHLTSIRTKAR